MTQAERRHDRLAVRLSLIISRLVAGETLNMARLAAEFGVSIRTLRRDFRERLMYLDLEYSQGHCRLRTLGGGVQGALDALTFAHRAGLADIFPGLDRRLAGTLLTAGGMPCLVWQPPQAMSPGSSLVFYRLVSAIIAFQRVLLLADGERCDGLAPYRLISLDGRWYLTGELNGHITVHLLTAIHAVTVLNTTFIPRKRLSHLTTQAGFIQALPHFGFIRTVLSPAPSEKINEDSAS
ncbi:MULTISPECIES: transcriptional regulator [Dickeya]|uniref:Predicted DNA-binding transcriptional regulator n=1 Tax=Dickeya aquatica TaxID=1401087 RepID=A0A375A7I7_9GAMM|nr:MULTISPECIES: transcriptional regulator [Dickeya]SLM61609.1 predicted DNA-binding transcriptional regulator [Dickeya aquatica]